MMMAATLGKGTVGRITSDPQLAKFGLNINIKNAAVKMERHLMSGKRVNRKFLKKLMECMRNEECV